ncbi:MAG TPA: thioredoxin domain-containing protein [Solirubrobacteraceae bacterium]|nr:thioredoxin domain-containing protein [Solirubrobacteraceae bacterium]
MSPVDSDEEDLTRKQRREQARAQRKAMEEAEAAQAVRRTRLTQLGIVVAVVVVAIVVIAIAAGGSGSSSKGLAKKGTAAETQAISAVDSTIGGIPQNGNVLGSPTAPVTLVYFGDLQCPICREFTLGALPSIVQKWVRSGKVKIEYRSLETATREPEVFKTQQIAALAAGKQKLMWNYLELFYHEQGKEDSGYVTESYLQGLAHQVPGLNIATWTEDRKDPTFENQVAADAQTANNEGFNGTPSFLIGHSGGTLKKLPEVSLTESAGFDSAIESELKA